MAETVKTRYSFPLPILLLEDSSISFLKSNIPSEGVTAGGWGATKCLSALPTCALDLARWSQLSSQKLPGGFNSGFSYSPVRMSYLSSSSESCQLFPGSVFTATQEVRLTDCRFVKCACTSPFSKLLGTSEKITNRTHSWLGEYGSHRVLRVTCHLNTYGLCVIRQVFFFKSQFSDPLNRGTILALEICLKD